MSLRRLISIAILLEILYALFWLPLTSPQAIGLLIGVHAAAFVLLGWTAQRLVFDPPSVAPARAALPVILGFGILFRLTLVPLAPVGSDDIYRYLWDGMVFGHGVNPYQFAPADPRLAHLAAGALPALVNAPLLPTPYPPLSQLFFLISSWIFGPSTAGFKFLIVACDTATMLLLVRLLRRLRRSPLWVTLYAWSPLPVLYFGLDGHIDALGIPFLVAFLMLAEQKRVISGSFALGFAAMSKLHPIFLAPFLFHETTGWKRWVTPLIPAAILAAGFLPFWLPGAGMFDGIRSFSATWEFNGSVFWIFFGILQSNEAAHAACAVAFAVVLGLVFARRGGLLEKTFIAFVGFILLSPTVHPWYLTWIAALLVVRWSTPVFLFLGLSVLSNIVVLQYRSGMGWHDQLWIVALEYGIPCVVGLWLWRLGQSQLKEG